MPDDDSRRSGAEPAAPRTTPVPPVARTTPAPAPASPGPPADQPAVLELGGDATPSVDGPDPGSGPGRWTAVAGRLSGATAATVDRARTVAGTRLGPAGRGNLPSLMAAAVGVLAAAGSLSGEWLDFEIPGIDAGNGGSYADTVLLAELGTYGTAYLLGLLALLVCTALTLFGSHRIRPDARIAGLTTGTGLLALLVTVLLNSDELIRSALRVPTGVEVRVTAGAAVTAGVVGVGALLLALYLAGRATARRGGTTGGGGGAAIVGDAATGRASGGSAPADLTVGPTAPFVRPDNPPHQTHRW